MTILAIHCGHNASAALMIDGAIVGAVQEERFTKRKNQVAFPARAIRHLIDVHLGGNTQRIDRIVLASKVIDPISLVIGRYSEFDVADHIKENHEYWRPIFYDGRPADGRYWVDMYRRGEKLNQDHNVDAESLMSKALPDAFRHVADVERQAAMKRIFGWNGPFEILDHHACHAYYAFYGQPIAEKFWQDILVLTADSMGDHLDWTASTVDEQGVLTRVGYGFDHGVAKMYRFVTLLLGMKPNEHEYKVMGLSAFSKSKAHITAVERVFFEALDFRDGRFVREKPLKDGYFDLRDRLEGHRFDNIAAGLQNWASAVTRAWIAYWLERTGKRSLCFSGGLSMNVKMNHDIATLPQIHRFGVPASGGDETTPIGACFMSERLAGSHVKPLSHVYLGAVNPRDPENDWFEGLRRAKAPPQDYAVCENVDHRAIAKLLAAGHIVARCAGPMEFGARALGNRSILADPSRPENVKLINDAIKNRDFWMPFTPSILEEKADRYLIIPKGIVSPFMTIGYETTAQGRRDIPATLHPGDFSARPQFVSRQINREYWEIISAFEELTGIAALLNTSLNLHGDPMNSSVADAARTLALSSLAFLVIPGDRLLYKKSAASALDAVLNKALAAALPK